MRAGATTSELGGPCAATQGRYANKNELELLRGESELMLSSAGMERVAANDKERRFTFIVDGREYECSLSEACFLSPRVHRLLCSDVTADCLYVDVTDSDCFFEDVLSLSRGCLLSIDQSKCDLLHVFGLQLENAELCQAKDCSEFLLSSSGMRHVCEHDFGCFRFVVGDRSYCCGLLQACFLFPGLSVALSNGASLDHFRIYIDDPDEYFANFISLGAGAGIPVDSYSVNLLESISYQVGHKELQMRVSLFADENSNSVYWNSLCMNFNCESLSKLSFLASHFYGLTSSAVKWLTPRVVDLVLSQADLKLRDENSLVDMILLLDRSNSTWFSL